MFIALAVVLFVVLLIARAGYVPYSIGHFKNEWQKEANLPIEDDSIVLAALGDSTVQGVGALRRTDSFVAQVSRRISATTGKKVQVYNFSVSGGESGDVLSSQIPKLRKLKRVDAIMLAVGPNDLMHKKSLESFLKNYDEILKKLQLEKTVIADLPPMGPKDVEGKSSYEWGQALKPLAAKYKVAVAPVFEKVNPRANDIRIYGGDFFHPGKNGYKLWADAFEHPLLKILEQ